MLLIGDFRPFFGATYTILHAFYPGMEALNDNDEFPFTKLGALTLNVVKYLQGSQDHERDGERQTPEQRSEKQKDEDRRKAIEHGLREIERFENRYRRSDRS